MKNIVLKIREGDLFRFVDTEEKRELFIGSKRTADIVIHSVYVQPLQVRLVQQNGVWYAEDLSDENSKIDVLYDGKKFKKPMVKFDGTLFLHRKGEKKKTEIAAISRVKQIFRKKNASAFDLSQQTITTVGQNEKCDIRVDNPLVSDKHFFIAFDGQNCFIEDAHSFSGTYVNNKKIKRQKLNDYDHISIPSAAYTFFKNKLLCSSAEGGIRIDAANVSKLVWDKKTRKKISLVTNVSFRIEPGEFVAVVGGSGAGKSTMLDCINGMRPATDGKIYYDTNDFYENINSYKGVVGYVPQKDILHDDLTVKTALYYTAKLRIRGDLSKEQTFERVRTALADVSLTGKEHLRISALSGGQKKRVSIAMELLSDPKVIFLDEPTSGLSPDLDLEMMDLLKELASKGRTIVAVTHAMENLDRCDKVIFLGRGGRLCFFGKAKEALRWFNKRSFSSIFAALSDESVCESFAEKYRASDYYQELYTKFCEEYGKDCILPPSQPVKRVRRQVWELPPENLPEAKKIIRASVHKETETDTANTKEPKPRAKKAKATAEKEVKEHEKD